MSEPYSLCIYAPITPAQFAHSLKQPLKSAWGFDDWDNFEVIFSDQDIAQADSATPATASAYLERLQKRGTKIQGWHCEHDPETGYLSVIHLHWTDSWPELLTGFNVLRQVLTTSGDGQSGYILAHGFAFPENGTLGAIMLRNGSSQVATPRSDVLDSIVAHAQPLAERVLKRATDGYAGVPQPDMVDHLPQLVSV